MSEDKTLQNIDISKVIDIALKAGAKVMEIYRKNFKVEYKDDKSPLTEADKVAHKTIIDGLSKISSLPTLSEEGEDILYKERKKWRYYWLIDPIDGTKEFIKKNGEFTINIALIYKDTPVLGVVFAPAINKIYYAKKGKGAFKATVDKYLMLDKKGLQNVQKLPLKDLTSSSKNSTLTVVASKSHLNKKTQEFIDNLASKTKDLTLISKGSSLKLLMVAEGNADIYPRLAPTMEWDTAAADAVVREAGKMTYEYNEHLKSLKYNKKELLNPWFIVK